MEAFLLKAGQHVAALSLLVVIHEFGHYIFARIFGIRVDKFFLFFNPWFYLVKYNPKTKKWSFFKDKPEDEALAQKAKKLSSDVSLATPLQNAQFEIIQSTNPMYDEYHTGIRSPKEIKTFDGDANDAKKNGYEHNKLDKVSTRGLV